MRGSRWVSGLLAAIVFTFALAGCGGKKEETKAPQAQAPQSTQPSAAQPAQPKKESKSLLIWAKLTEPEEKELLTAAQAWASKTGNKVELIHFDGGYKEFADAAQAGKGPDIWIGMPHDNLGTFWKAGLLEPVPAGVINPADYVPVSISASTLEGKLVAVPFTMEAIALLVNTEKAPQVPATFDDLIAKAKDVGFTYDITNFYFTFGFIAGNGGYVFKESGGKLDPNDIGLASPEALAGLDMVGDLVKKHNLIKKDVNYDIAAGLFSSGKVAFAIDGPWAVKGAQDKGIKVKVMPVPPLAGGKPFRPFVGVQTAIVSVKSANKAESFDLIKHLTQSTAEQLVKTGNRIPVLKSELAKDSFTKNEVLSAFAASASNGTPMPNIPQMSTVWEPAKEMLNVIVQGKADSATAAKQAVTQIKNNIASQK